jgi:hypothetical protein
MSDAGLAVSENKQRAKGEAQELIGSLTSVQSFHHRWWQTATFISVARTASSTR